MGKAKEKGKTAKERIGLHWTAGRAKERVTGQTSARLRRHQLPKACRHAPIAKAKGTRARIAHLKAVESMFHTSKVARPAKAKAIARGSRKKNTARVQGR